MTVASTGLFSDNSEIFMLGSFYFAASLLFNAANSSSVRIFLTWSGAFGRANNTPVTTMVSPGLMPAVISTLLDNRMPVVTFEKFAFPPFTSHYLVVFIIRYQGIRWNHNGRLV